MSLQDMLGDAAFGLPQHYVALGVVAAVLLLVTLAMALQRNGPAEVAFLVAVFGGLLSKPAGMIFITVASLVGTIAVGSVLSALGVETRLTPEQRNEVGRALRRAGPSEGKEPPP